jgi:hypothetical protein
MSIVSEIRTEQESVDTEGIGEAVMTHFRSRVRTNVDETRFRDALERLGLMLHVQDIRPIALSWFWSGIGSGYDIAWRTTTTWNDLQPLSKL